MGNLYGEKGGKGGGGSYTTPEPPVNSLHSISYAKIIDVISEGEIEGLVDGKKSIFFDDIPLQNPDNSLNFSGVTVYTTAGTPDQGAVSGFDSIQNEIVYQKDITHQDFGEYPGAAVVTLSASNVDKANIKIRTSQLYKTNRKTGKNSAFTLEFNIYKKRVTDNDWVKVFPSTVEITGVTTATYEKQIEVFLGDRRSTWMLKVERVTLDKNELEDPSQETKGFDYKCESTLQSITEITEARLRYPDTAYVAMKVDAYQFGDSIPSRSFHVKGIKVKVPTTYNPATHTYAVNPDGSDVIWNGTFKIAWTNNPAWLLRHLLTNKRFGCGIDEQYIDDAELYTIGKYCDELVPTGLGDNSKEPRFTLNTVLSSQEEVITAISHITSVFRGMAFWSSNTVTTACDRPSDPVAIVTKANVVNGEFNYTSSSIRDRHSVALVTWNDPESNYSSQVEVVEDPESVAKFGWKTVDVTAFGCTSRGQAHRVGKWILYSERVETETITYTASLDHYALRPGDLIQVSDPSKDGARYGGRILSFSGNNVVLDDATNVSVSDALLIVNTIGQVKEYHVSSKVGNNLVLNKQVESSVGSIWQSVPTVLTNLPQYRIVSVAEKEKGLFNITGVYHDPNKYDFVEQDILLPTVIVNKDNFLPKAPTNIAFSESLEKNNNSIQTKLYVSWEDANTQNASASVKWSVRYRKDYGNWTTTDVTSRSFILSDVSDGELVEFVIRSKSVSGKTSASYATATHVVVGKSLPPSQVENFRSSVIRNRGVLLEWDKVPDVDVNNYVIKTEPSFTSQTSVTVYNGTSNRYVIPLNSKVASDTSLYIWAIDTSGNISPSAQLNVRYNGAVAPSVTVVEDSATEGNVFFRAEWNNVETTSDFDVKHYKVSLYRNSTLVRSTTTKSTSYRFQVTLAGTYSVSVSAVDIFGQESTTSTASKVCDAPQPPSNFTLTNDAGRLILNWAAATKGTLPVKGYIVSGSDTGWTGNSFIYKGSSTSRNVTENISPAQSSVTFYIRSFDNAGNQSQTVSYTFVNPGLSIAGNITTKVSDKSTTSATIKFKWPAASTVFSLYGYDVKIEKNGAVIESSFVNTREWTTNLDWDGLATFYVRAKDIKGGVSNWYSLDFTNLVPNQIGEANVEAVSTNGSSITLNIDWPHTGVRTTLPIGGYEIRNTDSGWGTSGFLYKGLGSQANVSKPLSQLANSSVYIRAFDTEGRYSAVSRVVPLSANVEPSVPTNVTVSYSQNKATVRFTQSVSIGAPSYEVVVGSTVMYTGASTTVQLNIAEEVDSFVKVRAVYGGLYSDYSTPVAFKYLVGKPTNIVVSVLGSRLLKVEWVAPTSVSAGINGYIIEAGDSPTMTLTSTKTNCSFQPNWTYSKAISVKTVDNNGVRSAPTSVSYSVLPPNSIAGPGTYSMRRLGSNSNKYRLTLDFPNAQKGTFSVSGYDIRTDDTNWNYESTPFKRVTSSTTSFQRVGSNFTYYIKPFDVAGNYAATSLVVSADGSISGALTDPTFTVEGQNVTVEWDKDEYVDLDVDHYEIKKSTENGFRNLGDAKTFTTTAKSTTIFNIRAIGIDARILEKNATFTVVVPSVQSHITTYLGSTTVAELNQTKTYKKIKIELTTNSFTFPLSNVVVNRDNNGKAEKVYEGNSLSFDVLAFNNKTTTFSVVITDLVGNSSSQYTITSDVVSPTAPSAASLSAIGGSRLRASISYDSPADFRNFSYTLYKFASGSTPAVDGSNWETAKVVSVDKQSTSQFYDFQLELNWGNTKNITKIGVKYGVKIAVYDTSGNKSSFVYSNIKGLKLI